MIIECKKCSARFRLVEGLLKAGGSRVRCSKCGEVFLAYPPDGEENSPRNTFASGAEIAGVERRRCVRFPVSIPTLCNCIDQDGHHSDVHIGTIKQISREGAVVEIFQCEVTQALNLSFIDENNKEIQINGKVRHSSTDRWGKMRLGLSLEGSPNEMDHFYLQAMRSNNTQDS